MKELHASQREREREKLHELRDFLASLQVDKRHAVAEVRAGCQAARKALPGRLRAYREAEKARLRRELAEARQAARNRCQSAKARIRAEAGGAVEVARRELAEERKTARLLREAERKIRKTARFRSTSVERRAESDDEVRGNIPQELVPVFDKVRRTIHAGPRSSRTEAFVEWAEENSDRVAEMRAQIAEQDFNRLLRQHVAEERASQGARRRPTSAELAAVPF